MYFMPRTKAPAKSIRAAPRTAWVRRWNTALLSPAELAFVAGEIALVIAAPERHFAAVGPAFLGSRGQGVISRHPWAEGIGTAGGKAPAQQHQRQNHKRSHAA